MRASPLLSRGVAVYSCSSFLPEHLASTGSLFLHRALTMWLYNLVQLVLMLVGFGIGSFAWVSILADDHPNRPYWWIGGLIGLSIGWAIAAMMTKTIRKTTAAPLAPPEEMPAPKPVAAKPAAPKPAARSEAITLLAALQREARFVDFVQESLAGYTDAQIGAAARDVHRDCGAVLARMFALRPAVTDEEGKDVEVPAGFDAGRWRLTGTVTGEPPFHGRLVHPGWEATTCELPTWSGKSDAARIVAPAEVELR